MGTKCPKCSTNNPDTQKFCGECATPLKLSKGISLSRTKTLMTPIPVKKKTIAGKYQILEKLGEGGMGVVYKAEDTKLKRLVVLKFLHPHLTADKEAAERFEREAQAAAALNHPNIITIHEISEHQKKTFIAMEYVEGPSLRDEISKGPMLVERTNDVAKQLAEGLGKAHAAGIIHRDIKPENLLIDQDGLVKIADFGIARMKGVKKLTKDTDTLGTLKYMSPEQFKNREVNHLTDIWSFGVVLFEMLTGQFPFDGESEAAFMYSVVNEKTKSLISLREDIPENLVQIVEKTLDKDPKKRFQNMSEILHELKKPVSEFTKTQNKEKSIIVLPFINMSPDPDQEYFSDGLTEEIIADLSHLRDLLVISRSSAMTFKGTKKKIREIAKEVNVQYVLEGSVRKAGNNIRITAQLIDATTDAHLWAEKYSGTLDDVFDIQDKVSRSIVDALRMKLSPEEDQNLAKRPIKKMQAYECYIKARQDIYTFIPDGLDRAVRYLQDGLEIIGENAVIYAGLGYAYAQYVNIGLEHEEYVHKAEEYAMKALELEPDSSEAHFVLGFLNLLFYGKPKKSIHHFKRSLAIFPDAPDVLFWLTAGYGTNWGKPKEARQSYNRLIKVDPFNPLAYCGYILDVMAEGQLDLPVDYLTKWVRMVPQYPVALFFSAQFLAYCNHFKEACALVDKNAQPDMKDVFTKLSLFVKYAIEGDKKGIKGQLTVDFVKTTRRDAQSSYFVSGLFALSGMKDEAFDWLENAVDRGFINFPFISEYDPFLKNIRGEERFIKLLKKVQREWENFEV